MAILVNGAAKLPCGPTKGERINWSDIALSMSGRMGKQCRERWYNHLDPSVVKGKWSDAEDDIIVQFVLSQGQKWSLLAQKLPGRYEHASNVPVHMNEHVLISTCVYVLH